MKCCEKTSIVRNTVKNITLKMVFIFISILSFNNKSLITFMFSFSTATCNGAF